MIYAKPSTSLLVVFRAYLASDHVTPATGKTIAITISKNGGAFGNPNAGATNATEISSGFYKVTLDTTDTGTSGPLAVRGAVATVDDVGIIYYVGQAPADVTHWLGNGTSAAASGIPKVDVDTIKTNPVVNAGTITFPTTATLASTTNITAGTVTTATNVTTVNGLAANVITATSIAADAITAAKIATDAIDSDAIAASAVTEIQSGLATAAALATVQADTDDIQTRIPSALGANGNMKADLRDLFGTILNTPSVAGVLEVDVTHVAGVTTDVATMPASIAAILVDTGTTLDGNITLIKAKTDNLPAAPASTTNITAGTITTVTNLTNAPTAGDLTATMKASVNTEVLDVLNVDTFAEPGQEAPAATNTLVKKIGYLFKLLRNKITQTSTTLSVFDDAGTTVDQKATISDDGTTYTRGEIGTGP